MSTNWENDPLTIFLRSTQAELGDDIVVASVFDVPSVAEASHFIGELSFGQHHLAGGWLPPERMKARVVQGPKAAAIHIAGALTVLEAREVVERAADQGWKAQAAGIGPHSKQVAGQVPQQISTT